MDEKRYHVRFGATCVTGFSQVIHTASFEDFGAFLAHLQGVWDQLWVEVFSADAAGGAAPGGTGGVLQLANYLHCCGASIGCCLALHAAAEGGVCIPHIGSVDTCGLSLHLQGSGEPCRAAGCAAVWCSAVHRATCP